VLNDRPSKVPPSFTVRSYGEKRELKLRYISFGKIAYPIHHRSRPSLEPYPYPVLRISDAPRRML